MDFCLDDGFYSGYAGRDPNWSDLAKITFYRTYSRETERGQESWSETCRRVIEGMYGLQKQHAAHMKLSWSDEKAEESAQEAYERMWHRKWLPPGRGLWAMGTDILRKLGSAPLNNCGFVSTKDLHERPWAPFAWAMDMLMLGVGVGFDTDGAHRWVVRAPAGSRVTLNVDDTREGWVHALECEIASFAGGHRFEYDYSLIRPAGAPIRTFGGTASGPGPLAEMIDSVRTLLLRYVGDRLDSTGIVDLFNLVGRCVVSGNVRRSAQIALGRSNDGKFLNLKDPELASGELLSHRWASNNSVKASVGQDYASVASRTTSNGEPGYVWPENFERGRMCMHDDVRPDKAVGINPCGEQPLESYELCNLVETFPARHESLLDWHRTLKFAYLYAKTVTLVPTHCARTNDITMRNRRIGTSVSGVAQALAKWGTRPVFRALSAGYGVIRRYDRVYSDWLCVPTSVRVTTVKPSGTVSLLAGATPGMHYPHSKYYIRRVRLPWGHSLLDSLERAGYSITDDAVTPGTVVVDFPMHEREYGRSKRDVSMWEQLELAANLQHYWSDNAVSCTVTFDPARENSGTIASALSLYETRLKSVSFLPLRDHGYAQAPYEEITEREYLALSASLQALRIAGQNHDGAEKYCGNDTCEL